MICFSHGHIVLFNVFVALIAFGCSYAPSTVQPITNSSFQVELSLYDDPIVKNAWLSDIWLFPSGLSDMNDHFLSNEDLDAYLRLGISKKDEALALSVNLPETEKVEISVLSKALADLRDHRDTGISTYVFVSLVCFVNDETRKDMKKNGNGNFRLYVVSEKPKIEKKSELVLQNDGFTDEKGAIVTDEKLGKLLRAARIVKDEKECVVIIELEKDSKIEMRNLAKAMLKIYAQRNPVSKTNVYVIVQAASKEKKEVPKQ